MRYDFNVFFSYGIIFLYSIFYKNDKIKYEKLILHILCGAILADIIWMIFMLPYYGGTQSTKEWKYTSGLRTLMNIMAFIELLIKGVIGYFIFKEYQSNNGDVNDLYKLSGYFNENNNNNLNLINPKKTPLELNNNFNNGNNDGKNDEINDFKNDFNEQNELNDFLN
jgi:hypothetical protein